MLCINCSMGTCGLLDLYTLSPWASKLNFRQITAFFAKLQLNQICKEFVVRCDHATHTYVPL